MTSERVFTRPCRICGKPFEYTYATKRRLYCDACKKEHGKELQRGKNERQREKQAIERRAKRIAHQQDTSVWVRDYADRQRQQTLAMLGRIEI